jgi:hypothetical protein
MKLSGKSTGLMQLWAGAHQTFERFPFALICAIIGTIAAVLTPENEQSAHTALLVEIVAVSALGLPLFTAFVAFGERRQWVRTRILLLQAGGALLLVAYFFSLPDNLFEPHQYIVRFFLLNIGLHFLVSFIPYTGKGDMLGFWQFNRALLLRFLTAALYSAVLYIGISIALFSTAYLFDFDISSDIYFRIWIVFAGLVNTWIFMGGFPRDLDSLLRSDSYPVGLRVFSQYILLPLVVLYYLVLVVYEAKIILAWNWPKDPVALLILWYSVVGILCLLFLYPLKDRVGNHWIRMYWKGFFLALVPLLAMLYGAILRRIGDYGITVNRYLVLVMAIGLTVVVLYFIFSKRKDIRVVPAVICCIAFLSAYGPWSAFTVSTHSQQSRLADYLERYATSSAANAKQAEEKASITDWREVKSIIRYLVSWHGPQAFAPWIDDALKDSLKGMSETEQIDAIASALVIDTTAGWRIANTPQYFDLAMNNREADSVAGYTYAIDYSAETWSFGKSIYIPADDSSNAEVHRVFGIQTFMVGEDTLTIYYDSTIATMVMTLSRIDDGREGINLPLLEPVLALAPIYKSRGLPKDSLTFLLRGESFEAKVIVNRMNGSFMDQNMCLTSIGARILLREN